LYLISGSANQKVPADPGWRVSPVDAPPPLLQFERFHFGQIGNLFDDVSHVTSSRG
jgi:hypothetical protein